MGDYGIDPVINANMDVDKFTKLIGVLDPTGKNRNPLNNQPFSDQYRFTAETGKGDNISKMTSKQITHLCEQL